MNTSSQAKDGVMEKAKEMQTEWLQAVHAICSANQKELEQCKLLHDQHILASGEPGESTEGAELARTTLRALDVQLSLDRIPALYGNGRVVDVRTGQAVGFRAVLVKQPASVVEDGSDEDASGQDKDEESDFELQLEAERCDEAEEEIALEQHLLDTGASVLALPAMSAVKPTKLLANGATRMWSANSMLKSVVEMRAPLMDWYGQPHSPDNVLCRDTDWSEAQHISGLGQYTVDTQKFLEGETYPTKPAEWLLGDELVQLYDGDSPFKCLNMQDASKSCEGVRHGNAWPDCDKLQSKHSCWCIEE